MKILYSLPDYHVEFGWLLMAYQAKIRAMSKNYDKTVVVAKEFGIYQDFAEDAKTADVGKINMWRVMNPNIDYIQPCRKICCNATLPQEFYRYEKWRGDNSNTILIHARSREVGSNRNWSEKKWKTLIRKLHKRGYDIVSIGTDVYDLYDVDENYCHCNFNVLCVVMANAKMLIGPSSGPMHLASIIGTPHVVWTDDRKWNVGGIKATNRKRYEKLWNPLRSKVTVIDKCGWDPSVEVVEEAVCK